MEDLLNELITTLEEMNDEKTNLSIIYKHFYTNEVKNRNLDDEMKNFLVDSIDLITGFDGEVTIDTFKPNDIMKYMYDLNLEKIKDLEIYALKLYRLYQKEGNKKTIPYYEQLEKKEIYNLNIIKEKDFISIKEFTIVYGYSSTSQKGFRGRLRNPIPYIQKGLGTKVIYDNKDVLKWLKKERNI